MSERTFKLITLIGTSKKSYEDAIENAVTKASKTLEELAWFEVEEFRGGITGTEIEYQVKLKIAFKLH